MVMLQEMSLEERLRPVGEAVATYLRISTGSENQTGYYAGSLQVPAGGAKNRKCFQQRMQSTQNVCLTWKGVGTWRNETQPWDPEQDSQPRSRSDASLVTMREVTILFGGNGSDSATWEYDGASWSQTMLEDPEGDGHPTARYGASFVYDSWRNVSVGLGGNQMTNETWEYDGQS